MWLRRRLDEKPTSERDRPPRSSIMPAVTSWLTRGSEVAHNDGPLATQFDRNPLPDSIGRADDDGHLVLQYS